MAYSPTEIQQNQPNERKAIRERLVAIAAECRDIVAKNPSLSEEQRTHCQGLEAEAMKLETRRQDLDRVAQLEGLTPQSVGAVAPHAPANFGMQLPSEAAAPKPELNLARDLKLHAFKGKDSAGRKAPERAYRFGMWAIAQMANPEHQGATKAKAIKFCQEQGIPIGATYSSTSNQSGGVLIPEEFLGTIIDLREERGVFRRFANTVPMTALEMKWPRRKTGVSATWLVEGVDSVESTGAFDSIHLIAKELGTLCILPITLIEDAPINLAEYLAKDIAYSIEDAVDTAGFLGNGEKTSGKVVGVKNALTGMLGAVVAASGHTSHASITLTDYLAAFGALAKFPGMQPQWFMNSYVHAVSVLQIIYNSGGIQPGQMQGGWQPFFLGLPVNFTQVMDRTTGATPSTLSSIVGDLNMAATVGNRRDMAMSVTRERYWEKRQVGVQAIARLDINVHERGTATVGGPIVTLSTAAS